LNEVLPTRGSGMSSSRSKPELGLFIETAAEYLASRPSFFRDERHVRMNCDVGISSASATTRRHHPENARANRHVHLEDIGSNRASAPDTGKGSLISKRYSRPCSDIGYTGW